MCSLGGACAGMRQRQSLRNFGFQQKVFLGRRSDVVYFSNGSKSVVELAGMDQQLGDAITQRRTRSAVAFLRTSGLDSPLEIAALTARMTKQEIGGFEVRLELQSLLAI